MKIYDGFTFFNENRLLQARLNYLSDVVDGFYIVEGSHTFTGKPKAFNLPSAIEALDESVKGKIRAAGFYGMGFDSAWDREVAQRNELAIFSELGEPDDIVVISDVDEIPNPEALLNLDPSQLPLQLDVKQFFWNVNWVVPDHCNQGARPVVALRKHLKSSTPQELRASAMRRVDNGGWHFSFFSAADKVVEKIESFAHTEYDLEEYKKNELIKYRIDNGIDPFDRFPLKYVEIDEDSPEILKRLSNHGEEFLQ